MNRQFILFNIIILLQSCIVLSKSDADSSDTELNKTVYDQRQSGKYNIHVNIKDVSIISLAGEDVAGGIGDTGSFYEDYYEDYDVSDYTVSPITATLGMRPTTTTKSPIIESSTTNATSNQNATVADKPNSIIDVINEGSTSNSTTVIQSTTNQIMSQNVPDSKPNEIPVQIVMDPLPSGMRDSSIKNIRPVLRSNATPNRRRLLRRQPAGQYSGDDANSRVLRIKPRQSSTANGVATLVERQQYQKCSRNQFRDRQGVCRTRRSGMRRIMNLLSLLNASNSN